MDLDARLTKRDAASQLQIQPTDRPARTRTAPTLRTMSLSVSNLRKGRDLSRVVRAIP